MDKDQAHDFTDPTLLRAFAAQDAAADAAWFVAGVMRRVDRARRWQRLATAALTALGAVALVAVTPVAVDLSYRLAESAVSPLGAVVAMMVTTLGGLRLWRDAAD